MKINLLCPVYRCSDMREEKCTVIGNNFIGPADEGEIVSFITKNEEARTTTASRSSRLLCSPEEAIRTNDSSADRRAY